jgi:glycosyltransferase involved in cell wall biosynthesis
MEIVDGVQVVRRGRQWSVHIRAFLHYRGSLHGRFDAVIDEVNTIPFFTPLWARIPAFMLIWQLAREVWWYESPFPLSAIGYLAEPLYLRAYTQTPVLTFSQSTLTDLRRLGFQGTITKVPPGIEDIQAFDIPKSSEPLYIYVGRLAPSKRVHEIVEAFALFRQTQGSGRLLLMGSGSERYIRYLEQLATRLGVKDFVDLAGWLRGVEKHWRMAEAHALLMASAREGWGLVVTECNACGTPAVVYDVPGLRDSVRHLETGLVVPQTPRHLADGMIRLFRDRELYCRLQTAAREWSHTFTYDAGYRAIRDAIVGVAVS